MLRYDQATACVGSVAELDVFDAPDPKSGKASEAIVKRAANRHAGTCRYRPHIGMVDEEAVRTIKIVGDPLDSSPPDRRIPTQLSRGHVEAIKHPHLTHHECILCDMVPAGVGLQEVVRDADVGVEEYEHLVACQGGPVAARSSCTEPRRCVVDDTRPPSCPATEVCDVERMLATVVDHDDLDEPVRIGLFSDEVDYVLEEGLIPSRDDHRDGQRRLKLTDTRDAELVPSIAFDPLRRRIGRPADRDSFLYGGTESVALELASHFWTHAQLPLFVKVGSR